MTELLKKLEGSKTYGLVALGLAVIAAVNLHWLEVDPKIYTDLKSGLILAALAALRASK